MENSIYKILTRAEFVQAERDGVFAGSAVDLADGFIHFSAAHQLRETCAKHFSGLTGLVVLVVETSALPAASLKWEPSRGGALFPHLYAALPMSSVRSCYKLPHDGRGGHDFMAFPFNPDVVSP